MSTAAATAAGGSKTPQPPRAPEPLDASFLEFLAGWQAEPDAGLMLEADEALPELGAGAPAPSDTPAPVRP